MTTTERSNKNRQLIRQAGWLIAVPLLTLLTNVSWYAAAPPDNGNRGAETLWAMTSSFSLLIVLTLGARWSIGARQVITSATFYRGTLTALLLGLLTAIPPALLLFGLSGEAETGKDPSAIAGTGSAYVLAAFALPAALSALLVAAGLHTLAQAKDWWRQNTTLATAIACGLVLCLGAGLLSASQSAALGPAKPVAAPPPAPMTTPTPPATPSPDPNASVLPPECPAVAASSVQALRIPAGGPENMVTSVLNTYSAWLSSGTELMGSMEWRAAPAHCTSLLASAYGNAYTSSIFSNQTGAAWLEYFNGQTNLNAKILEALRTSTSNAVWMTPASYRLDRIIDTNVNPSGNYLKFEATLDSTAGIDWQSADRRARWYVQLIPWQDFYIIDYVEAIAQ
ncbi:hypothetical protein [Arthrobacter russicus]|uniref:Uncharacterized protein n=1 Tax=Arthrobacter russicus TaxID=172040 RepID=A0ABU1JCH5_9MICC|nr:hypothetical protein [Arthrobacter russicus]MDR6270124.1 hypothetical protein [Arthrobacter russicus]